MNPTERIINKLTSGKFCLSIIGGIVFLYVACNQILPPGATATILTAIFMSYFRKGDSKGDKWTNDNSSTTA